MPKEKLTAREVLNQKRPGRYGDGGGLYLNVRANGSRAWLFRYRLPGGRTRDMGLGSVDDVTLSKARDLASKARERIRAGEDPIEARTAAAIGEDPGKTFREVGDDYVRAQQVAWKNRVHRAQWASTLATYVYPVLGGIPVSRISTTDVLAVLTPIWTARPETASRVRGRIERILASAKALGLRSGENPAAWRGNLQALLAPSGRIKKAGHHKSLDWKLCPGFLTTLIKLDGSGARALLFTMLTAARTSETLGATWGEIDLEEKTWTVPGNRMKADKLHRVPLGPTAMAMLKATPPRARIAGNYIFHDHAPDRPLSNMTMSAVLRRLGVTNATVHGFRASFRTWAGESDGYQRDDIAEAALAHMPRGKTAAAYQRGDLLDLRAAMMASWDAYLLPNGYTDRSVQQASTDEATVLV